MGPRCHGAVSLAMGERVAVLPQPPLQPPDEWRDDWKSMPHKHLVSGYLRDCGRTEKMGGTMRKSSGGGVGRSRSASVTVMYPTQERACAGKIVHTQMPSPDFFQLNDRQVKSV